MLTELSSHSRQQSTMTGRRRILPVVGAAIVVVACGLYIGNYLITPRLVGETQLEALLRPRVYRPFSRDEWRDQKSYGLAKYSIANELCRTRLLIDLDQTLILEMLGEPTFRDHTGADPAWYYEVARQDDLPAKSWLFPGRLLNCEKWALRLDFGGNRVLSSTMSVP